MALNFPDSPTLNQVYTDTTSGFSYQWDGVVWQSYTPSATKNILVLDDISGSFDSSTTIFNLTNSGTAVTPANAQQLRVTLGGIVQEPGTDYIVAASTIIFTTAPDFGIDCSIVSLGTAVSSDAPSSGNIFARQEYNPTGTQTTFTVTSTYTPGYLEVYHNGVKLVDGTDFTATNGSTFDLTTPAQNGDVVEAIVYLQTSLYTLGAFANDLTILGNATVAGITTLGGTVKVGVGTTALIVEGDARITGILTIGTSSVTIDGVNNEIKIGTGVTISSTGITGSASTVTSAATAYGLSGTPDIDVRNITGVAATFTGNVSIAGTLTYEDVTNVDSIGIITARSGVDVTGGSIVVGSAVTITSGGVLAGVVTATSFVGDGSGLTSLDAGDISAGTLAIARGGTNSTSTPTQGGAAYGTGTAFAFTSAGSSGQVLTSNGTSAPTWQDAGGGAWNYISSVTASNSASVAFTGLDSTYDVYVIIGIGVIPTQDSQLRSRTSSNNGSSYDNSSGDYSSTGYNQDITVGSNTEIELSGNIEASSSSGCDFEFYSYNPSNATRRKYLRTHIFRQTTTVGQWSNETKFHMRHSTSAINAIQFYMQSGNISTGTFRLYGISNS